MSKKPEKPGSGAIRVLRTKVKKKSGLKESSRRWLERHLNDPYVQRSKADGFRSRAAYKLIEIDDKHHLLKPGMKVIDLGAAPGGWCQVAAQRTKSSAENPHVVGIDYLEMDAVPGAVILKMDFLEPEAPARLAEALEGAKGQVLGYCRSGTRSTLLWALAEASKGEDPDALAAAAASAGYDVSPVRPAMDALAAAR